MIALLAVPVAAVAVVGGAAAVLVVGLRRRDRRVVGAVTRWQRSTVNPRQLATAGGAGARMSVVEHPGRRTGRRYSTPVGIREDGGDLVVMLPYGPGADWVRNVRAAGAATVRHDGRTLSVLDPEVVAFHDAERRLTAGDRWTARLFGIREVLVLHVAESGGPRRVRSSSSSQDVTSS